MQELRLRALIDELRQHDAETPWIEFKVSIIDPEKIGKIISALSNGARLLDQPAGYLLWGIENATHEIVGTTFRPSIDKVKGHPYPFWMAGQIQPSLQLQFHEIYIEENDVRVVLLEIPAANHVPTKFQGRAYIRIGDATPPLSDHSGFEAALMRKLTEFSWEAGVASSFMWGDDVLRMLDYRTSYDRLGKPIPMSNALILDDLTKERLVEPDVGGRWRILNLGAILFANHLDEFDKIKRKALRIVKYSGRSKAAAASEMVIPFGYVRGYSTMIEHIHAVLPKSEEIGRVLRVSIPVYPDIVIRELTANALIHQDMTVGGSGPMIDIFDDRMEITNPGSPLVDPSRFLDCPPRSRNESMASLLRRFDMCEERGSGVRKVIANIEIFQLPAPDFISYDNGVRVCVFAPMKFGELDMAGRVRACYQHAALQYLSHQKMTNSTLRKRFGIGEHNAAQVSKVIAVAIEEKRILKSQPWSTRSGHYLPYWAAVS